MLIDFKKPLLDLKGKVIAADPKKPEEAFLLMDACQQALVATFQNDDATALDKVKRGVLALKIDSALPVEITIEEAALIKKLVDKLYGTLIYLRVDQIFEAAATSGT